MLRRDRTTAPRKGRDRFAASILVGFTALRVENHGTLLQIASSITFDKMFVCREAAQAAASYRAFTTLLLPALYRYILETERNFGMRRIGLFVQPTSRPNKPDRRRSLSHTAGTRG